MSLPGFSVRRPVTTVMIYLGLLLLGVIAVSRLPQDLYPPIAYPQLTVVTHYRDAAPEEIEILVTKVIEEAVGTVPGVRRVSSYSKEELSLVVSEFNWGSNMEFAALGVREKIDLVKERLPRGSEDPVVIKYNPFEPPVLVLNLSGDVGPHELLNIARKQVKNELEKVDGVAAINISGGLEREILVQVDHGRLQASGIPITQISDALSHANLNYPAGSIKEAFYEYLIRTIGEFSLVKEIPGIAITVDEDKEEEERQQREDPNRPSPLKREKGLPPKQRLIMLRDIATVSDTLKEQTTISRFNGKENISLSFQKQAGGNTVQVVNKVREEVIRLQKALPPGVTLSVASDQSILIKESISTVKQEAFQGGALACFFLYLFLGSIWASFNIALAIPIAIMTTFTFMYFGGMTLNILSLGGLAFSVGLLVDAGIVVVESIATFREQGMPAKEAAVHGAEHEANPIIGTVLTTIVVFLPLIFVIGLVGQFMKDFSITVSISNLVSLVVSLSLTALFASLSRGKKPGRPLVQSQVEFLIRVDKKIVAWSLKNKILTTGVVIVLFVGAIFLFRTLDVELMPKVEQGQFTVNVSLPPGTRLDLTNSVATKIERVLGAIPEVQDISVLIGSSKERSGEELLETLGSHQGRLLVNLKPLYKGFGRPPATGEFRTRYSSAVIQELEETLKRESLEGAQVECLLDNAIFKSALAASPIVVEVKGAELGVMEKLADQVKQKLGKIPGLYGVKTSMIPPSPETRVNVNKDRAAAYHLSVSDIALTAQTAIKGYVASKFKEEGREFDIRVQLREEDRADFNKIRRLVVHSPLDIDIPISEVAYLVNGYGPTEIMHLDQQRTVLVSAQLFGRAIGSAVKDVTVELEAVPVSPGYTVALTGENKEIEESFRSLVFALLLSLILVYMVLASEFESLWEPFLIMGTIPMSVIGVSLALWISGTSVNVMVGIGFLVLGGIVVDNGIVLIECVKNFRQEGMDLETALIEASARRLRPIIMTASTTIFGLVPIAFKIGGGGAGAELQAPMGVSVIGGLMVSTFLTLIFLPTFYAIGDSFFSRFKRVELHEMEAGLGPVPALAGAGAHGKPIGIQHPSFPMESISERKTESSIAQLVAVAPVSKPPPAPETEAPPEPEVKPEPPAEPVLDQPPVLEEPPPDYPREEEPPSAMVPLEPLPDPGSPQGAQEAPPVEDLEAPAMEPTPPPEFQETKQQEELPVLEPPLSAASEVEQTPSPGMEDIPEDFGREEAVPEKPLFEWNLPMGLLNKPEFSQLESESTQEEGPAAQEPPAQSPAPAEPTELPPSEGTPPVSKALLDFITGSYKVVPPEPGYPSPAPPASVKIPPSTTSSSAETELPLLNARQEQLLSYLKEHGRITRKEYVQLTGASVPTAARDLASLVDRGLIKGVGPLAKGRYYVLLKQTP